jgi:hypothetical protein
VTDNDLLHADLARLFLPGKMTTTAIARQLAEPQPAKILAAISDGQRIVKDARAVGLVVITEASPTSHPIQGTRLLHDVMKRFGAKVSRSIGDYQVLQNRNPFTALDLHG